MDKKELIISVESKEGKDRRKTMKESFLCLGGLDLSAKSMDIAAIKLTKEGKWYIDKDRCSKCYLCKLNSKHVALDDNHFPYIIENEDNKRYILNLNDEIDFETCLATYNEESGLSKWVYSIFRIFGIEETFTECAISKDFIPKEILEALGRSIPDGVYRKSVIPDIEGRDKEFIFVFENKKYNPNNDTWILEAIKQIILYAYSNIYRKEKKEVIFVFCYNGSRNILDKVKNVLNKNSKLKGYIYRIFNENTNYKFSLLPSSEIYNSLVKRALEEGEKQKTWIINTILKNVNNIIDA